MRLVQRGIDSALIEAGPFADDLGGDGGPGDQLVCGEALDVLGPHGMLFLPSVYSHDILDITDVAGKRRRDVLL